ncbi:alpha/beta fold hydrolase [Algicola sagamiensis]|uniref:alpha/beta fold hydrolase n=1 Tax=Algicola sagamiensis TaxID=163869 RepID=UPI00038164F6|nr:alpha/beta hydrolase [Algicola sagamiensis]
MLIMLPGMDGTGELFAPFLKELPANIPFQVIPLHAQLNYLQQVVHIADEIGEKEVILLVESYSGMLGYLLCQNGALKIKHVIFVASFLRCSSQLARLANYLPLGLVKKRLLPDRFIGPLLFHHWTPELVSLLYRALGMVEVSTINIRLNEVAQLSPPTLKVSIPCTVMSAKHDCLVHAPISDFESVFSIVHHESIDGGHFLLQSNPKQCWEVIYQVIETHL